MRFFKLLCTAAFAIVLLTSGNSAFAGDTQFTYQGSLMESGSPMTGTVDIDVSLWNALSAGSQVGSAQNIEDVPVTDGLFSLELDYGAAALDGDRWLEITINGTTLSPRQKVTASPYSIQTRGIFVDDDGQVAIGTPVPTAQLDVRVSQGIQPAILATSTAGGTPGLIAIGVNTGMAAILTSTTEYGSAIEGIQPSPIGNSVRGLNTSETGIAVGVIGESRSNTGRGVVGLSILPSGQTGVSYGVYGDVQGNPDGYGVFANGKLGSSGFKTFRIDHPTDPANKYLVHYSSEGPEPINEYSGNVNLGADGSAWVQLPDYFEMINIDFRYTLTAIGAPAPGLYIASEVQNNAFQISGGKAGLKVSWEVKARRNDPYARAYGAPVVVEKQGIEVGKYLQPQLFGQPASMGMTPIPSEAEVSTPAIER